MPTQTAVHHRWSDIPREAINAAIVRRFITGDRMTVAWFELARGGVVARHDHEQEQISCVLEGALKFMIDGVETVVRGGEVMQIPGQVPHAVEALENSKVLDVFCPVRQDWLDKTDTYFNRT